MTENSIIFDISVLAFIFSKLGMAKVIDEELIGGYNEVEDLMKGLTSINKV